jgi:hypothetical protein
MINLPAHITGVKMKGMKIIIIEAKRKLHSFHIDLDLNDDKSYYYQIKFIIPKRGIQLYGEIEWGGLLDDEKIKEEIERLHNQ